MWSQGWRWWGPSYKPLQMSGPVLSARIDPAALLLPARWVGYGHDSRWCVVRPVRLLVVMVSWGRSGDCSRCSASTRCIHFFHIWDLIPVDSPAWGHYSCGARGWSWNTRYSDSSCASLGSSNVICYSCVGLVESFKTIAEKEAATSEEPLWGVGYEYPNTSKSFS